MLKFPAPYLLYAVIMSLRKCSIALLGLASSAVLAAPPHQHGVGTLNLGLDAAVLELEFIAPLADITGFEHAPGNPRETEAVRDAARRLRDPAQTFDLPAAAGCRALGVQLSSSAIAPALLGEAARSPAASAGHHHAHDPEHAHDHKHAHEHADLQARYRFRCASPGALKSVEVRLFKTFPSLRSLSAQIVAGDAQRAQRLTPAQPTLQW